ncbi:MAG: phosphorylated protein phosphatase, partial [uncultured bacterium]
MATTARPTARRPREAAQRPRKGSERQPKQPTAKSERGVLGRMMDVGVQRLANRRDRALADVTEESIRPEEQLRLNAIDRRVGAAGRVSKDRMDAIVEEEKRYNISSGSVIEASPNHATCEDNAVVDDDLELYAVIDGMSQPRGNDVVARDIARLVGEKWKSVSISAITSPQEAETAMKNIMDEINGEINVQHNATAVRLQDRFGAVGTVVKLITLNGKRWAVVGHTGDTRLYVRHADGQMEQKTQDQGRTEYFLGLLQPKKAAELRKKFANVTDLAQLNRTKTLKKADGTDLIANDETPPAPVTEYWLYEQGNYVSQGFGVEGFKPQILCFELKENDQLLLTSDGIHDLVPDSQIGVRMNQVGVSPQARANALLADSEAGIRVGAGNKTQDDRTAIVVNIGVDRLNGEVAYAKKEYRGWANGERWGYLSVPVTTAQIEGLNRLLREEPGLRAKLEELAQEQYERLMASGIDTKGNWRNVGLAGRLDDIDVVQRLAPQDVSLVDRQGIYAAKVEDMITRAANDPTSLPAIADVLRASIKYMETTEIAQDDVLLNAVMDVLEQVALRSSDTKIEVSTLVGNSGVIALAAKLGFKPETVAELLIKQIGAIGDAARQQEKSQRSLKLNLAKAAMYAGTGIALTASMVATPLAALVGVGAVRMVDAFVTTRIHDSNRRKIEATIRTGLRDAVVEFKGTAEPERTNGQVKPELRGFVDSFVAMLALAKRDQITEYTASFETREAEIEQCASDVAIDVPVTRKKYDILVTEQENKLITRRRNELELVLAATEIAAYWETKRAYDDYIRQTDPQSFEVKRLETAHNVANERWLVRSREIDRIALAEAALYRMDRTTRLIETQAHLSADSRKNFWDRHPSLRALVGG